MRSETVFNVKKQFSRLASEQASHTNAVKSSSIPISRYAKQGNVQHTKQKWTTSANKNVEVTWIQSATCAQWYEKSCEKITCTWATSEWTTVMQGQQNLPNVLSEAWQAPPFSGLPLPMGSTAWPRFARTAITKLYMLFFLAKDRLICDISENKFKSNKYIKWIFWPSVRSFPIKCSAVGSLNTSQCPVMGMGLFFQLTNAII